jgi:hypothetical protein
MVEMALVFPLLVLLVMGVFEFGMAWRSSLTVSNAMRSGARAAANSGVDRLADYNALVAMTSSMENIDNADITKIVIYRSADDDSAVPAACLTPSAAGAGGANSGDIACNVYEADDLASLDLSDFPGTDACEAGSLDAMWCPLGRENRQSVGADYVGVYMEVDASFQTGLFGDGITIEDETVMRIEPEAR